MERRVTAETADHFINAIISKLFKFRIKHNSDPVLRIAPGLLRLLMSLRQESGELLICVNPTDFGDKRIFGLKIIEDLEIDSWVMERE